jgi:type IV pilus assembly protein PilN
MIRINLLPVRAVKKAQAGQRQLLIFLLFVIAEGVGMFALYQYKSGEVDRKKRKLRNLDEKVEALRKQVGDFDMLRAQRDRLLAQRDIINQLQKARSGPVWTMRELSEILTPGKGPTVVQAEYEELLRKNPNGGFNPRWNPNRLWVESFVEQGGAVRIVGKAKDYDDVAEFNKRLTLSKYFTNEFLERNDQIVDTGLNMKVVRFQLSCRTTY